MKIIHCADIHLDSKMETNLTPAQARDRRREILSTFSKMVSYAKDNDISIILIAGDFFDTSRITARTKSFVLAEIEGAPNIDFIYLAGNHDESNFIDEIEDKPINLKTFSNSWSSYTYDDLVISGVNINEENIDHVYETINFDEGHLNIVMLHGQEVKTFGVNQVNTVNLMALKNKFIDYLALGHIHTYKLGTLDKRGVFCYPGCLEGRGFDELGEKGFSLINIENKKIVSEFVPFASRTLYEVEVDISECDTHKDIMNAILSEAADINDNSLVKVALVGRYTLDTQKDINHLSQDLNDKFYFAKVEDHSKLEIDIEDYVNDVSLKGEFIRLVLSSNAENKDEIIMCGIKALSGEDLD